MALPGGSEIKNPPVNSGDTSSIPGLARSPREGNGDPLQYSYLGNPMDRGAWKTIVHGVTRVEHDLATKQSQHKVSYTARATSNHSISVV